MLRITRIDRNRGNAFKYLQAGEYYRGKDGEQHSNSRWIGAEELGLAGTVQLADMTALGDGFAPDATAKDHRGRALCRNAGDEGETKVRVDRNGKVRCDEKGKPLTYTRGGHRIGFDCTFSADKSVSLLYAAADDEERERILGAHKAAVESTIKVMTGTIQTRRGHSGVNSIGIETIPVAAYTHFGNRELEPQLHDHAVFFGVCKGADGEWGTWDAAELYRHQQMYSALYRTQLAVNLHELGYGIDQHRDIDADGRDTGAVYFGVSGISEELCDAYSTRHKQIVEHVAEHGGNTWDASLSTRKEKEEPPFEELSAMWKRSLDEHRAKDVRMFRDTSDLLGRESQITARSDRDILAALHEREAVWTKQDLIAQLAREHIGELGIGAVLQEADAFLERNELVRIRPEQQAEGEMKTTARRYVEDRYAAQWWIDGLEQSMLSRTQEMTGREDTRTASDITDQAIKDFEEERGFQMSGEQRDAVQHLANAAGIGILEGRAGTGKTTTTDALVKALQADNRYVIGCAPSWDAAKKLESETGVKSASVARLLSELDTDRRRLQDRDVIIMDEASMVGTADLARLVHHCHHAGAKLILEGDAQQLQAVSAGGGFRMLAEEVGEAKLTEIRRQREEQARGTVEAFYADDHKTRTREEQQSMGAGILARLESNHQIDVSNTKQQAIKALVEDWSQSSKPLRDRIVIAATRDDVRTLNLALRSRLQESGGVGQESTRIDNIEQGKHTTIDVAKGDRLRIGKRSDSMKVVNGTVVVVDEIVQGNEGQPVLLAMVDSDIKSENGHRVIIDTAAFQHFAYAYAGTVHKSQGQTKEECYHLAHSGMTDRHLSLVAASRARGSYQMYGAAGDIDALAERLGMDRLRVNALEQGRAKGEHLPNAKELAEQARAASDILRERREREFHSH